MLIDVPLNSWIVAWLAMALVVLYSVRKPGVTSGLVLAYTMQMFVLHWLAAALYLLPWRPNFDESIVFAGLQQSTYAIAGFTIGAAFVLPWFFRQDPEREEDPPLVSPRLLKAYLGVGILSYGVLTPLFATTPTISALVTGATSCTVLGIALGCWNSTHTKRGSLLLWLLPTLLLPFVTIAVQGFLGYGLGAVAAVVTFLASFYRPRWKVLVYGLAASYLGLSLYVTYMRDRSDIRRVVWGGESMSVRLTRLSETFSEPEPFDLNNIEHLQRIDDRLNQNYLVGASVMYLRTHENLFARGQTIWEAVLAPIPRALWPNKPIVAGSGDLVSRYTGIRFAENTSVGIGQVLELYVNFGGTGVFLGFILLGIVLAYVDRVSAMYRSRGDWARFAAWFLPGLSMVQIGGSLVEVTASAGAGVAVAAILNRFLHLPASVPARDSTFDNSSPEVREGLPMP